MQTVIGTIRHLFPGQPRFDYQQRGELVVRWQSPSATGSQDRQARVHIDETTLTGLEGLDDAWRAASIDAIREAVQTAMSGYVDSETEYTIRVGGGIDATGADGG